MRKLLIKEIIVSESRFSIIDESTTVSNQSTLIAYFSPYLERVGNEDHLPFFVDLIKLDNVTASVEYSGVCCLILGTGLIRRISERLSGIFNL